MSYKQVLCVLLSLSTALNTFAYNFMVDGLAYNVLSADDKTVEVTFQGHYGENYETLATVNIPSSVTVPSGDTYIVVRIGDYAFYCASSSSKTLQSISIPSSVTEIGKQAFYGCYSVKNITIDDRNPVYKSVDNVIYSKDGAKLVDYISGREGETYIVPNGVTSIDKWAFAGGCYNLRTLVLPYTLNYIGDEAFYYQVSPLTIYCYADVLPTIGKDVFNYTTTDKISAIYVPSHLVDAYKAADQWKDHNIQNGTIALDETSADTPTQLRSLDGEYVYAQLNRSFVADGAWYTLCLPFALTADEVAESFGQCELMKLDHSQKQSEDLLYIHFNTATAVEAGTPYLFRPASTINSPVFKGVTINMQAATVLAPADGLVSMTGTYSPMQVPDGKWYLGPNNTLYQPQSPVNTNGFRAYFTLASSLGNKVRARVVMNGQISTDFDLITTDSVTARKVIEDGQVYIVRNGVRYNLQGQKIAQ